MTVRNEFNDIDKITKETILEIISIKDQKISYKLEDCLKKIDTDIIDKYFKINFHALSELQDKEEKNKLTNLQLKDYIIELFGQYLKILSPEKWHTIAKIMDKPESNIIIFEMAMLGFSYVYYQNGDYIWVIPNELKQIFSDMNNDQNDLKKSRFNLILDCYLNICGAIPMTRFKDLLKNYYQIDYSDKEIETLIRENKVTIIKDKYYVYADGTPQNVINNLIDNRKYNHYKILSYEEVGEYLYIYKDFLNKVLDIVQDKEVAMQFIWYALTINPYENCALEFANLVSDDTITKDIIDDLTRMWEEYVRLIRLWSLNGYTLDEYNLWKTVRTMAISKLQDNNLDKWLSSLTEKQISILQKNYNEDNTNTIRDLIIDSFKEEISNWHIEDFQDLIDIENKAITDDLEGYYFEQGYFYSYRDNNELKLGLVREIKNIIINKLEQYNQHLETEQLILGYMELNGILEKKQLKTLLLENHNINISINELDKYIIHNELDIYDDEYYLVFENTLEMDTYYMLEEMIKTKKQFGKYKKYEDEGERKEDKLRRELSYIVNRYVNISSFKKEQLIISIMILVKRNVYSKEILANYLSFLRIKLNKDNIRAIDEIIQKYKDDIELWIFNGYTMNELKEF